MVSKHSEDPGAVNYVMTDKKTDGMQLANVGILPSSLVQITINTLFSVALYDAHFINTNFFIEVNTPDDSL